MSGPQFQHPSCERACGLLFEFIEGALPEADHREVEDHFARCPPCRDLYQSYRSTPSLCRKALHREAPEEVVCRVKDFLRKKLGF